MCLGRRGSEIARLVVVVVGDRVRLKRGVCIGVHMCVVCDCC